MAVNLLPFAKILLDFVLLLLIWVGFRLVRTEMLVRDMEWFCERIASTSLNTFNALGCRFYVASPPADHVLKPLSGAPNWLLEAELCYFGGMLIFTIVSWVLFLRIFAIWGYVGAQPRRRWYRYGRTFHRISLALGHVMMVVIVGAFIWKLYTDYDDFILKAFLFDSNFRGQFGALWMVNIWMMALWIQFRWKHYEARATERWGPEH